MNRYRLAAAVSLAPFVVWGADAARATDTITTSTATPVATATATSGAPDNVDIAAGGSVKPTAAGTAVTLNSNNTVTNEGTISFSSVSNTVGIKILGGYTGSVTSTGAITLSDGYTPTTDSNNGLAMTPFAQGTNRTGIQVIGPGTFTGGIANLGPITINGDSSFGVDIQAPITGSYRSLQVTPATSSNAEAILAGSIIVTGGESNPTSTTGPVIGFHLGSGAAIGGNVDLGLVSATGVGAQGVVIDGSVAGSINLFSSVTTTGYRSTSRSGLTTYEALYTAAELAQGGSAVVIGGNVGGGVIISAPPIGAATNASTASDLINGQSILQTLEGTGSITTYGAAPALQVGRSGASVELGVVGSNNTVFGEGGSNAYGLVIQGSVVGNGVWDQVTSPNLPAPAPGTAIQIGDGLGDLAKIDGGIYNTGAIQGAAYQANATGIHFASGGQTPLILNDGTITATSTQVNTATTGVTPLNIYGILIDAGASVGSLVNNSGIIAEITGEGGVGGTVSGIVDRSGTLNSVLNTGTISAQGVQTLITSPMPVTATAIDISSSTAAQTVTQAVTTNATITGSAAYNSTIAYNIGQIVNYQGIVYQAVTSVGVAVDPATYPADWREIGALSPFISGSVLFGSGGSTLSVAAGTVSGPIINLGTGTNNALVISGASGSGVSGATVAGALEEVSSGLAESQAAGTQSLAGGGNGTLSINVNNGTLIDLNPNTEYVKSVNVGANGFLQVAADPANGTSTKFLTTGASTFAQGAQLGLSLLSVPTSASQTFVILQTVPGQGTLSAGTFGASQINSAPWLFTASAAYVPNVATPGGASSELQITVAQKSAAALGFNAAEASALDAVLAASPQNPVIEHALLSQFTEAGLKSVYDQLLPNQGQGLFEALEAAAQAVGSLVSTAPEESSRVAGTSLWLQEVNERIDRSGVQTEGSNSKLFGVVGGYEISGPGGGAAGLTLAYYNADELSRAEAIGSGTTESAVEAGAYYRRSLGKLTFAGRAAVGYAWYSDNRILVLSATSANGLVTGTEIAAHSNWGGLFYDGHVAITYEEKLGRFYARPELSADYLGVNEGAYSESGGGGGYDLTVASRVSTRASGQAILVVGRQWGQSAWLRTEIRGGYREVFAGQIGDTVASFSGGSPFSLAPDSDKGGWFTAGFSIKGGSQFSYLALEGDIDLRGGEQRYDLRIAGRSMF